MHGEHNEAITAEVVGVPEAEIPTWATTLHLACALAVSASGASGSHRILGAALLAAISLLVLVHSTMGPSEKTGGVGDGTRAPQRYMYVANKRYMSVV